jgi:hypothetical protein
MPLLDKKGPTHKKRIAAIQAAYDTLAKLYAYTPMPDDAKRDVMQALNALATAFPNDQT